MFKVSSKDNKVTKTMSNHKNSSFVNITTSCLANNCFILFEQTKTTDLKETLIINFLCSIVFVFWFFSKVVKKLLFLINEKLPSAVKEVWHSVAFGSKQNSLAFY